MELVAALKRVGGTVVKQNVQMPSAERARGAGTFYVRVDPEAGDKWVDFVTNVLVGAKNKEYTVDISKYFYAENDQVKYLWRIVLTGNVAQGLAMAAASAIASSAQHAEEITSFPLVGRATYEFDPLRGKIKGGHDYDVGVNILGLAMAGSQGMSAGEA